MFKHIHIYVFIRLTYDPRVCDMLVFANFRELVLSCIQAVFLQLKIELTKFEIVEFCSG